MDFFLEISDYFQTRKTRAKSVEQAIEVAKRYKIEGYKQRIVSVDKKTRARKTVAFERNGQWVLA